MKVNICTKCGKRAVSGLCDVSLQGNMTQYEYFASGTEPSGSCDCHVAVTSCKTTGHAANNYCPDKETKVYLYEGTEGTEDTAYVVPVETGVKCEEHTNLFDKWFGGEESEEDGHQGDSSREDQTPEESNQEKYPEYEWENIFPWNW